MKKIYVLLCMFIVMSTGAACSDGEKDETDETDWRIGGACDGPADSSAYNTAVLQPDARANDTYARIKTGAVQCETGICLNLVKKNPDADFHATAAGDPRSTSCYNNPISENCDVLFDGTHVVEEPVLLDFSFCSCRCEDGDGNRYSDNPDKFDNLCECPGGSQCIAAIPAVSGLADDELLLESDGFATPNDITGGYCVPECVANPCETLGAVGENFGEICTPSKNSEQPWAWTCEEISYTESM